MRRLYTALSCATLLIGCIEGVEVRPLAVTISATPTTAAVDAPVEVTVSAQGQDLVHIELNYGDGTVETQPTNGATTAQLTRQHSWTAAGTYQTVATVLEARGATKTASVTITIQ